MLVPLGLSIDTSFFDTLTGVWGLLFGFFPTWFQVAVGVALALVAVLIALKIAKFIKDLVWPF